jgi:predicted nucleotidyltransferase component of viral defense system
MAKKLPANIAASVRAHLLNLARDSGQPFDVILTRYVLERLLYRLSRSRHTHRFVLKGAMLLTTWLPHTNRGTRDLDLLAFGDSSEERILGIFREIVSIVADDGVVFNPDTFQVRRIREEFGYGGLRLRGTAQLASARVTIVIDIAFGDSVEPGLETIDYPALLDQPPPRLRAYAPETVLAVKFQAMVALGRANS